MSDLPPPRRLPVLAVFSRSFTYAWERRDHLILPYLVYAAVAAIMALIGDYGFGPDAPVGTAVTLVVDEIFGVALAVGLHRYVLLDEPAGSLGLFRWDRYFGRYLVVALLLGLTVLAFLGLFGTLGSMMAPTDAGAAPSPAAALANLLLLIGLVAAAAIFARLFLLLPAAALGEKLSFGPVWQASRGNGFRLLATALLVLIPFASVEIALLGGVADGASAPADTVVHIGIGTNIALALVLPLERIVLTIMLSLEYDVLVRGGGPAQIKR